MRLVHRGLQEGVVARPREVHLAVAVHRVLQEALVARPTRQLPEAAVAAHQDPPAVVVRFVKDRALRATQEAGHRALAGAVVESNEKGKARLAEVQAAPPPAPPAGAGRVLVRRLVWEEDLLWAALWVVVRLQRRPTNSRNQAFQQALAAALKHSKHNLTSQHRLELDLGQGVRHSVPSRKYYILFVYMGLVEEILKQFPDCDRMMAETIAKMYEQGRLEEFLPMLSVPAKDQGEQSEPGRPLACRNIEVHLPEEKTLVESIPWSEDKSAV